MRRPNRSQQTSASAANVVGDRPGLGLMAEATPIATESFSASVHRLRDAQKSAKGAPPYSIFVNRPLGRVLAAAAHRAGLTPDQVTGLSACSTFAGIAVLALVPPNGPVGLLVALLLVLGYALDSADGQLARLRGGGSPVGEWLDHLTDATKLALLPAAVLISCYRFTDLPRAWLLVPLAFGIATTVHFFGMVLVDLLARERRAQLGRPAPAKATSPLPVTLAKLPTDYGVQCLLFLALGATTVFATLFTVVTIAMIGYTALVAAKWTREVRALDAVPRPATTASRRSKRVLL